MTKSIFDRAMIAGLALAALTALPAAAPAEAAKLVEGTPPPGAARTGGPVIFVRSHDLYYDSILLAALPNIGPFQKLETGSGIALETDYGPGDLGFFGDRWWVDADGDNEMDDDEMSIFSARCSARAARRPEPRCTARRPRLGRSRPPDRPIVRENGFETRGKARRLPHVEPRVGGLAISHRL